MKKQNKLNVKVLALAIILSSFAITPTYAWRLFGTEWNPGPFQCSLAEDSKSSVTYGTYDTYFFGIKIKSVPGERGHKISFE